MPLLSPWVMSAQEQLKACFVYVSFWVPIGVRSPSDNSAASSRHDDAWPCALVCSLCCGVDMDNCKGERGCKSGLESVKSSAHSVLKGQEVPEAIGRRKWHLLAEYLPLQMLPVLCGNEHKATACFIAVSPLCSNSSPSMSTLVPWDGLGEQTTSWLTCTTTL